MQDPFGSDEHPAFHDAPHPEELSLPSIETDEPVGQKGGR